MGPLMGNNKAAWGVKLLLLTTVSSCQVDCGRFCALLRTWHCCLPPCVWCCPPSASHPPQHPPRPLPLYTSSLILQVLKKTITKTSSVSYYYYRFYRLGTGRFHKKAKPVRYVTQSQRNLLEIKWGRTLLNFKSKKKPLQGRTEPAGHPVRLN